MRNAQILKDKADDIAISLVTYQYQLRPSEWQKYGKKGIESSIRDAHYLISHLYETMVANDSNILVEYSMWANELFENLMLPQNTMYESLTCLQDILNEQYPGIADLANNFIDDAKARLRNVGTHNPERGKSSLLNQTAQQYISYLLEGNRLAALKLIEEVADNGYPVRDIYLEVFQPAQYQIGELWLKNKISVAHEHFCTAVTQQAMSILYPKIFSTERKGLSFVAACIGNELHEIGIRMVADFFEMDGWDTYYLGANTPAESIVKAVNERNANLLGLSIALPIHRSLLRETISTITPLLSNGTKIMIGGYALNQSPVNPEWFGAHGYAHNALVAISVGKALVA